MSEHFEVIVVGSGAGGGLIAGELADAGRRVLLLEAGPYLTAADYMRWEAHANHTMWWPIAFAEPADGAAPPLAMFRGRLVGGTTSINTKVALRPHAEDYAKWHAAAGLTGDSGEPFGESDLLPYLTRVEERLGVRERTDWQQCVHTVLPGFEAMGASLKAVRSYTDPNCMRCGSCLQGCPTNAGKNTQNVYVQPALVEGRLELRADCTVRRVLIEDGEATGVEYSGPDGSPQTATGDVIVVAAGSIATPGLLIRSGLTELGTPSSAQIGRNLGFHIARLVEGEFDQVQDAHMVYPISAHCMQFAQDEQGGFAVEASTVQDPIGFATALCDENDAPVWGQELVEAVRRYRYYSGLLTMVTDENTGTAWVDDTGRDRYTFDWSAAERERLDASLKFAREVLKAAGAKRVFHTAPLSTHMQGSCRMGSDPARSVVDAHGESHDVRRLFVGDSSVIPRTLSVNPSLTIMALASRLAHHIDAGEHGYLGRTAAAAAA